MKYLHHNISDTVSSPFWDVEMYFPVKWNSPFLTLDYDTNNIRFDNKGGPLTSGERVSGQLMELTLALSGQCCITTENFTFIDFVHPFLFPFKFKCLLFCDVIRLTRIRFCQICICKNVENYQWIIFYIVCHCFLVCSFVVALI